MRKDIRDREKNKRLGGRAARQALRSAPLTKEIRPVKSGLLGGTYNPLSQEEITKIHYAAFQVHLKIILNISTNHRPLEKMNIIKMIS